jgi:hypothetical protein
VALLAKLGFWGCVSQQPTFCRTVHVEADFGSPRSLSMHPDATSHDPAIEQNSMAHQWRKRIRATSAPSAKTLIFRHFFDGAKCVSSRTLQPIDVKRISAILVTLAIIDFPKTGQWRKFAEVASAPLSKFQLRTNGASSNAQRSRCMQASFALPLVAATSVGVAAIGQRSPCAVDRLI